MWTTLKAFCSLLVVLCLAIVAAGGSPDACHWCDDVYKDIEDSDVKIVAMLGLQINDNQVCSKHSFGVWKAAIAMKWAVSMVNGLHNNSTAASPFIQNVRIGLDIINDCSVVPKASFHAAQLISDHTTGGVSCYTNASSKPTPLAGLIGTSTSETTITVANTLRHYHLPLVGVSATVQELSDKKLYPMFIRAVPADIQQAQIIVELAKELKWYYMVGIHSDSKYGRLGMQEVKRLAQKEHLCINETEINEDFIHSENDKEDLFRKTLFTILDQTKGVLGVVYFGEYSYLMSLLKFIDTKRNSWTNPDRVSQIHWILPDAVPATDSLKNLIDSLNTKAYLIGPSTVEVPSFSDYLADVLSAPPPWLTDQWQRSIKAALESNYKSCQNFTFTPEDVARCRIRDMEPTSYLTAAIDSVYIMVSLLAKAHASHCKIDEGVCPKLQDALRNGLLSDFTFPEVSYEDFGPAHAPEEYIKHKRRLVKSNGDLKVTGQSLYSVTQHVSNGPKSFDKVAFSDSNNNIVFNDTNRLNDPSECKKDCKECHQLDDVPYIFKSGTAIIVGVFTLHMVSETDAFQCGAFRSTSLDYLAMEAFINVTNRLRHENGIDYGYLIIDDCYSPVRASKLLLDAMGKAVKIVDEESGEEFNPDNVWVVIGPLSSPSAIALLSHLRDFHIPMITYSATTPSLNDKVLYPFFSRTLPSDTLQAQGVVEMLKYMNATHVGVIVIDNIYGLELHRLFVEKAEKERICVEEALIANDYTRQEDIDVKLGEFKAKRIKVIALFTSSSIATKVMESPPVENHDFHFVASEAMTLTPKFLTRGMGKRSKGLVIFVPTSPEKEQLKFRSHFETLNGFDDKASVWLRTFWESYFHCDLPGSFYNTYEATCPKEFSEKDFEHILMTPRILRTGIATISAGRAISDYLQSRQTGMQRKDIIARGEGDQLAKELTAIIRKTKLPKVNGINVFDKDGNENSGFDMYNIQKESGSDKYIFVKVGVFGNDRVLTIDQAKLKFYDKYYDETQTVESTCTGKPDCENICGARESPLQSTEDPPILVATCSSGDSDSVGYIVGCALLLALLVVAIVVIILMCRGKLILCPQGKKEVENYNSVADTQENPALPPRPCNGYNSANSPRYIYPSSEYSTQDRSSSSADVGAANSNEVVLEEDVGPNRRTPIYHSGSATLSDTVVNRTNTDSTRLSSNLSVTSTNSSSEKGDSNQTFSIPANYTPEVMNRSIESGASFIDTHEVRYGPEPTLSNTQRVPDSYRVRFVDASSNNEGFSGVLINQTDPPPPRPHRPMRSEYAPQIYYQEGNSISKNSAPREYSRSTFQNTQLPLEENVFNEMERKSGLFLPGHGAVDASSLRPFVNPAHPSQMISGPHIIPNENQNQQVLFIVHNTNSNNFNGPPAKPSVYTQRQGNPYGVLTAVNPQTTYSIPRNSSNALNEGFSNQGYLSSPDEDLGRPVFVQNDGNQPNVYFAPRNQMSMANPKPHSRSKRNQDYLDATDSPIMSRNEALNVQAMTQPNKYAESAISDSSPNLPSGTPSSTQQTVNNVLNLNEGDQIPKVAATLEDEHSKHEHKIETVGAQGSLTSSESNRSDTSEEDNSNPATNSAPTTTNSTTTTNSIDDNNNNDNSYKRTVSSEVHDTNIMPPSSLTSNPISFGFQPQSKFSIGSESPSVSSNIVTSTPESPSTHGETSMSTSSVSKRPSCDSPPPSPEVKEIMKLTVDTLPEYDA